MSPEVLRLTSITKTFPGVTALDDVSFDVCAGEVHALVGENGAGKSTLIAVAAGVLAADHGTVEIGGHLLGKPSPGLAQEMGLAVVYQHATVLDDLTVAENLAFSVPAKQRPAHSVTAEWAGRLLARVGADVEPGTRARQLSIAQRQLVEIARALALESRILILDEPTESLTSAESAQLFEQIARLRAAGTGIVYISHRFPEVRQVADRITVLRDGQIRGSFEAASVTEEDILQRIVGREVDHVFPAKAASVSSTVLGLSQFTTERVRPMELTVGAGEIVGLAGVEGNGQRDLIRALAGLRASQGTVLVAGQPANVSTPSKAQAAGLVYLPGDRHAEGAFLPLTVRENVSPLVLAKYSRGGFIRRSTEAEDAWTAVGALHIRTPGIETPLESLSGGNQQKTLIARCLAAQPHVLLADEPTRGVDVGARVEIYRMLREFADNGHAVVVLSSDAAELAGLCDRVLVFSRGQVVEELHGTDLTQKGITSAAITTTVTHAETGSSGRHSWWSRLQESDHFASAVLAALVIGLGAAAAARNPLFLSSRNITGILMLASILMFVAAGQLTVLVAASIDLSVGPLMGLTVVLMSFFAAQGKGVSGLLVGSLVSLAAGLIVGLANALGIRAVRLPAVIATLVTYIFLQGLALVLRPTPAGYIDSGVTSVIQAKLGPIPVAAIVASAVGLALEWVLRRSRPGVELRAVGSEAARAHRVGARVGATVVLAHLLCSTLAVLAGIVLTSIVGVGQAGLGGQYTLTSITAVVLGGASIFGGRGSFVGALLGALLLQEIASATSFVGLPEAWQEWLPGILILFGAALFSRTRRATKRLPRVAAPAST